MCFVNITVSGHAKITSRYHGEGGKENRENPHTTLRGALLKALQGVGYDYIQNWWKFKVHEKYLKKEGKWTQQIKEKCEMSTNDP